MLLLLSALAEPATLECCDSPEIERNLGYYLRAAEGLAKGEKLVAVSGQFFGWAPIAKRSVDAFTGIERDAMSTIAVEVAKLKSTHNREKALERFEAVSRAMSVLVLRHRGSGTTLVEGHCKGRPWLQRPGPLASPYGDCGELRTP